MNGDKNTFQIAYLPWLKLDNTYCVNGIEFIPVKNDNGSINPLFSEIHEIIDIILSLYADNNSEPIINFTVVNITNRDWNISDSDYDTIKRATSLLFLASWAKNEYYSQSSSYINSSTFRIIFQKISLPVNRLTILSRRRDGNKYSTLINNQKIMFNMPWQCSQRNPVAVDTAFLEALNSGCSKGSNTIKRLTFALPFVELANTDDSLMTEEAEAILMGSAFQQLLGVNDGAYMLGRSFGGLFESYGSISVADVMKYRPGIEIDKSNKKRADAQPKWFVHRKWIKELHKLRSKFIHEGTSIRKKWGWSIQEHLVMAAWVIPLTVKLLLEREGHYKLTDLDKCFCMTVDKLLSVNDWGKGTEESCSKWDDIIYTTKFQHGIKLKACRYLENNQTQLNDESI